MLKGAYRRLVGDDIVGDRDRKVDELYGHHPATGMTLRQEGLRCGICPVEKGESSMQYGAMESV